VVPEPRPEDLFARLERERLDADRLYNEALTELDSALHPAPSLPDAPRPFDATRVAELNAAWDIVRDHTPAVDRSLGGRLRGFIWRLIGPPLDAQRQFNAALVDHLNRNAAQQDEGPRAVAALLDVIGREFDELARFQSLLVQYLQTITVYVDSKDRSLGGPELATRLATTEQRMLALKRELDRMGSPRVAPAAGAPPTEPFSGPVDSLTYVGFEDQFRGSQPAVSSRVEEYVPLLAQGHDIVDIGCGRGELLGLLSARGTRARGVDANPAMVELCRAAGLEVEHGDAVGYLESQPDDSIGGLVAVQVVEHFAPTYLTRFLETAYHKMRVGAPLVLETINPSCWMAFFETYIRDLTHQRPLHPDTLRYLVQASGFTRVDVQFRRPVRAEDRLARVAESADGRPPGLAEIAAAVNAHADTLNNRLFSFMDYVVIARR
jgi:SAM-dependent methyltransferase